MLLFLLVCLCVDFLPPSVVDRETQYFIAEATRSLNLRDPSKYENEEDVLWAGCSAVSRKGKLCEVSTEEHSMEDRRGMNKMTCNPPLLIEVLLDYYRIAPLRSRPVFVLYRQ